MLTDIFADRYTNLPLWKEFTETERRVLNQCIQLIEQLFPYWTQGQENPIAKASYTLIHDRLCRELGKEDLAQKYYSYQTMQLGQPHTTTGTWTINKICRDFICMPYQTDFSPDRFMKERLSFIELAFRHRDEQIRLMNLRLEEDIATAERQQSQRSTVLGMVIPGKRSDGLKAINRSENIAFQDAVHELNERFLRANYPLNYHNGFIQASTDELTQQHIENAFWSLVAAPIWKNVDSDMKEALDQRDANGRDPAFFAARALESAIKIISDHKCWTHGKERGAHNYIDNLSSEKNGAFITSWERDALKSFFTEIRNPFSHGAGSKDRPELTPQQTSWAIESCMSWVKSLVLRM
ncbi:hypothetical protein [Pseudomonas sp. Tri1]|uniref:AbiJ-NTD4 domain-containing protein n=1 Tax=Pseudomonas sp. Tri1 TaxID=2823875 RepID=UPI001B33F002|nr:hypothetical protein [Pseudomonas sp. Tri1]